MLARCTMCLGIELTKCVIVFSIAQDCRSGRHGKDLSVVRVGLTSQGEYCLHRPPPGKWGVSDCGLSPANKGVSLSGMC